MWKGQSLPYSSCVKQTLSILIETRKEKICLKWLDVCLKKDIIFWWQPITIAATQKFKKGEKSKKRKSTLKNETLLQTKEKRVNIMCFNQQASYKVPESKETDLSGNLQGLKKLHQEFHNYKLFFHRRSIWLLSGHKGFNTHSFGSRCYLKVLE